MQQIQYVVGESDEFLKAAARSMGLEAITESPGATKKCYTIRHQRNPDQILGTLVRTDDRWDVFALRGDETTMQQLAAVWAEMRLEVAA